MARETILQYIELLERSDIIATLRSEAKEKASLAKPDKIYLNNTNILYALALRWKRRKGPCGKPSFSINWTI